MPRKSRKYSFPILKESEIIKCMRELEISVEINDLKHPNEERFKIIYTQILGQLTGIDLNYSQIPFSKLSMFAYPELHEKSLGQIGLVRNLIILMQRVGVKDFCMSDLISPVPNRTVRNLSAVINFAKFRVDKWDMFQKIKKEESILAKEFELEQNKNGQLAIDFRNLQQTIERQEPTVETLKKEVNQLKSELNNFSNQHHAMDDNIHQLKKTLKDFKARTAQDKIELNKLTDNIQNLEANVVKSPQKVHQVECL